MRGMNPSTAYGGPPPFRQGRLKHRRRIIKIVGGET